jgi:hypothetical protein
MHQGIFRKEGEYWTVGYRNSAFRLRDTKGLAYLAHLLRHPGIEFNVLDLAGGIAGEREDETSESAHGLPRGEEDLEKAGIRIASLGDAGDMLDDQAKADRHRLSELREELEEAKELGNIVRGSSPRQRSSQTSRRLQGPIALQRVQIIRKGRRWCWISLHSREPVPYPQKLGGLSKDAVRVLGMTGNVPQAVLTLQVIQLISIQANKRQANVIDSESSPL